MDSRYCFCVALHVVIWFHLIPWPTRGSLEKSSPSTSRRWRHPSLSKWRSSSDHCCSGRETEARQVLRSLNTGNIIICVILSSDLITNRMVSYEFHNLVSTSTVIHHSIIPISNFQLFNPFIQTALYPVEEKI
jgi:hypothetical protein